MIKATCLVLCLWVSSGAMCPAAGTDSCTGLEGSVLNQCLSTQQTLKQQQQLELQLQQQQERQNQLDQQQREVQQQLESMRLQNESLRQQLARETARMERESTAQAARPMTTDFSKSADVKSWKADNPWFGSDYVKTQFAMRYVKELQKEQPDLAGRDLLDALSSKVNQTFAAKH
jgi:chromosome segregation ATPase